MEQEKQTQPEQKKKRLSTPLLIFIILMAVTLTLCAVVAGIWLHGRSSLRNQGAAPTDTPDDTQQLDSYTVLHDGKYYRYKDHMVNLLLIGVDSDNKPAAPLPYGSDNQADVILVVDDGKIAFNPAVELSYLDSYQQRAVLDAMELNDCTPSHAQSIRLKKLAQEGVLDDQMIYAVLAETKPNQQEQLKFKREELRKYFPSGYTEEQMRRDIIKGLELLKRQRERNRDAR